MIYYRIATQPHPLSPRRWLTTTLTSLQAVMLFLQMHRSPTQAHWRIFFASSAEALEEMLAAEQEGKASFSLTPAQFLSKLQPHALEAQQKEAEAALAQVGKRAQAESGPINTQRTPRISAPLPAVGAISALELRRLELELGAGGDHDTPYVFAFPRTLPEIRAWLRLRAEHSEERFCE